MFPPKTMITAASIAAAALLLTACTADASETHTGLSLDLDNLATTTTAGTEPVDEVKWNLPYEPMSLDPIFGFNYAENTVTANLCESLVRMTPDLSTEPGLATAVAQPDDTTLVYTIRDGVTFWNGNPLTADDVAYSLQRQVGETATSYFASYFVNVDSVEVSGPSEVTVKLKQPDVLFAQAMGTAAGAIVEKAAAEAAGEAFGTPDGGLQCTGPFQLDAWNSGRSIELTANPGYWDPALAPKVQRLSFSFIADESTAVNALRTGEVDGQFFYLPPAGLSQLENGDDVTTTYGKSLVFWTMITTNLTGGLADERIREALSLAIDREGLAKVVFQGAAVPATTLAGPDYWGYESDAFATAYEEFSADVDLERAKQLVAEAGAPAEPIVLAVQGSSAVHEQTANLIQAAGQAIGLTIESKVIPVEQFGNLYFDESAREGLDGFFTTNYGNFADPLDVYTMFHTADSHNYSGWDGADAPLAEARATTDPAERAELVIEAQEQITKGLSWIPLAYEPVTLVQNTRISGATASFAYLYAPWAATIGGVK
ncbi:peptide/nickel transport system substrate-binding protein [Agromyces sp. 3263]|uniref:ABC transporter substrate-binding protein n=1 Tax=Agromyces sp. 3263 TaxID=2817750 RepID=UPI002859E6AD|nr:ABC transporter substrate-binding protein [Agromyces sp. 3263]MDR6906393.1 peptide/nickel transport system substrate-binding protein [Agromyces sp. 3263]